MAKQDHAAAWIWATHHRYTANCYVQFRKHLALDPSERIKGMELCCHCFGEYRLYLDDQYIGRKGAPDNTNHPYYEKFVLGEEATGKLTPNSRIYVIAHNDAVGTHNHPACGGGFWLEGTIELYDGRRRSIQTDATWQARIPGWWNQSARQMFWTAGFQEEVDLSVYETLMKEESDREDETDPVSKQGAVWDWADVVMTAADFSGRLEESPVKKLQERLTDPAELIDAGTVIFEKSPVRFISPGNFMRDWEQVSYFEMGSGLDLMSIELEADAAAYRVFDFGTEIVGFPVVSFTSDGEGMLLIGYSECLDEGNRLDPARQGIEQIDTIRFGAGTYRWEMFNRRAFRYMQISVMGKAQTVRFYQVAANSLHYPLEEKGFFSCSNEALNQVYKISRNTLRLCMNGSFEDCPLRERAQYLGDVYVESVMAFYAFGEYDVSRKALLQFAQEQRKNGWIPSIVPGSTNHNIADYLPLYISTAWNYYLYSADEGTLREIYPNLERLVSYLASCENQEGFLEKKNGWWIFIDWAELGREGVVTALQCLYYRALIDFSRISVVCNAGYAAEQAKLKAERLRRIINERAYNHEAMAYVDCIAPGREPEFSIQTNCMAILTGVADSEQMKGCGKYLQSGAGKPVTTAYFKNYELQALHRLGLRNEFWRGFDYWIRHAQRNTPTWWETFSDDMKNPPAVSLCHGWGAGPLNLLPQYAAGVTPVSPGFKDVRIAPDMFDLDWMWSHVPTPYGVIRLEGKRQQAHGQITVSIPKGIRADILLPEQLGPWDFVCCSNRMIEQKSGRQFFVDAADACAEVTFKSTKSIPM